MAILSKKQIHPIDAAAEKSGAVHKLFSDAKANLDDANAILDSHVAVTEAEIKARQDEVAEAKANRVANATLSAKLADFVA